ncbi:MAG: AraC family transcriptional regulator [Lachnospiraceae bacterium]|nr:AraC family transcriptional regulator [Lachnospiraceae bacterium]
MNYEHMLLHLYDYNEDELFYKKYYYARQQEYSLQKFLAELDMKEVLRRRLLIPEKKETMPPKLLDSFFFDMNDSNSIVMQRHNRYSPAFRHSHNYFEFIFVYDGTCKQEVLGTPVDMVAGDICVIPPNIEHIVSVYDDSLVFNILMRRDTMHNMFYQFLNHDNILSAFFISDIYAENANEYIMFRTGNDAEIKEAILRMYWEYQNRSLYYNECISSTLMLLFYLLVRGYSDSVQMPRFKNKLDVQRFAMVQYVSEHFKEISLSDLAAKFHYTPEYTSRLIKEATGLTYSDLLSKVRMERACEMLVNTNMTVAAISDAVGFEATEPFIRRFKKSIGMTPTAYRKKQVTFMPPAIR